MLTGCLNRSSGSEGSMAVVPKVASSGALVARSGADSRVGDPRVVANIGDIQAANSKMAEELEKVNSDLAQALKGLQEVCALHISNPEHPDFVNQGPRRKSMPTCWRRPWVFRELRKQ